MKRIVKLLLAALTLAWVGTFVAALRVKSRIIPSVDPAADEVVLVGIFAPIEFASEAESFRGGAIECWYGGGVIDLRSATLSPAGAVLDVRAVFGGGQILVPESWRVTVDVRGPGGIRDTRQEPELEPAVRPELLIEGVCVFGGFAIASEL